jgi:hypothetical protein
LIQHDGARPSTSRGFRDEEDSSIVDERSKLIKDQKDSSEEEEEKKETEADRKRKLLMAKLMRIPELISSLLVSITLRLHRVSRSYRYVMRVLAREKKTLKVIAVITDDLIRLTCLLSQIALAQFRSRL